MINELKFFQIEKITFKFFLIIKKNYWSGGSIVIRIDVVDGVYRLRNFVNTLNVEITKFYLSRLLFFKIFINPLNRDNTPFLLKMPCWMYGFCPTRQKYYAPVAKWLNAAGCNPVLHRFESCQVFLMVDCIEKQILRVWLSKCD